MTAGKLQGKVKARTDRSALLCKAMRQSSYRVKR